MKTHYIRNDNKMIRLQEFYTQCGSCKGKF